MTSVDRLWDGNRSMRRPCNLLRIAEIPPGTAGCHDCPLSSVLSCCIAATDDKEFV